MGLFWLVLILLTVLLILVIVGGDEGNGKIIKDSKEDSKNYFDDYDD